MFQQLGFVEILMIAGFVVLALGFIVLFRLAGVLKASANKNTASSQSAAKIQKAETPAIKPEISPAKAMDQTAIVAVLASAVAAYMETSPGSIEIRSYRRLKNGKPSWSKAGRHDIMKNQF